MSTLRKAIVSIAIVPVALLAQAGGRASATLKVGPAQGTVIVVGGGSMGPEIYNAFITAAGGPDALIINVPNAGGADSYPQDRPSLRGWKQAGAKNIYTLFTKDRKVADTDTFTAILKNAGGVWFEGGRQFRLVDAYAGTKTEAAFNEVLARGGVIGGSSAGATILGDFLVRGAPSNDNSIMHYPGYEKGFSYLRGVGIDQHVVARERLPDLADSIITKFPQLLGISEDEGTAWIVRGDTATIVGRNKAFVYNGKDATDAGKPFLTLYPGDVYDMGARRVMHRAADESPVTPAFVRSMFKKYDTPSSGGATVLVAQNGKVFVDQSFGIRAQPRYMPTTTVPQFSLGGITGVFKSICSQLLEPAARDQGNPAPDSGATGAGRGGAPAPPMTPFQRCVAQRASMPVGMHKTRATEAGDVLSNVDELYRLALGLENPHTYTRSVSADSSAERESIDYVKGWQADTYKGATRYSAFGTAAGKRSAFVRIPEQRATIIILTNDETADARGMADRIVEKLLGGK
ncbi:MAG: cyanophycinase [Gemmatimonadaceae bacterium]